MQDLYGGNYYDEPLDGGASRSFAEFNEGPGRFWSVRNYKRILPEATWLPESHRRAWLYIGVFPNAVFGFYPDSVKFEDKMLTIWSSEAALSSGFDGIILSDLEYNVRAYHDRMRSLIPVLNCERAPEPGTLEKTNAALISGK